MDRLDQIGNNIENLCCTFDNDVDVKYILKDLLAEIRLLSLTKADKEAVDGE